METIESLVQDKKNTESAVSKIIYDFLEAHPKINHIAVSVVIYRSGNDSSEYDYEKGIVSSIETNISIRL